MKNHGLSRIARTANRSRCFMSFDDIVTFAVNHYVVVGLAALCVGIGLNLVFSCGPDVIEAIRHPRLH